jgi:hypothetical protein
VTFITVFTADILFHISHGHLVLAVSSLDLPRSVRGISFLGGVALGLR